MFDIANKAARAEAKKKFDDYSNGGGCDMFGSLIYYLETGLCEVCYRGMPLLYLINQDVVIIIDNNVIYALSNLLVNDVFSENMDKSDMEDRSIPVGIIAEGKNGKKSIIMNGDEDFNDLVQNFAGSKDADGFPTISFRCLDRFFSDGIDIDPSHAASLLSNGKVVVVAFTPNEYLSFSDKQKAVYRSWSKAKSDAGKAEIWRRMPLPPAGFTFFGIRSKSNCWHRSSTVVLRDMRKKGRSILMGQDEDMYFGAELPTHPETVAEAFKDLTPVEARIPGVERQGEWFVVPVDEKDVPKRTECIALFQQSSEVSLPIDNKDSALHTISAYDGRISKQGVIYAKCFKLSHSNDDHAPIEKYSESWYAFYRNTAVRSFSEQGVD